MTQDFEELLRRELQRIVPEPPDDLGRASGARQVARRKSRHRAGLLTVTAVTAAVAALAVVPTVLNPDEGGRGGVTFPDDERPTRVPTDLESDYAYVCPEATETLMAPSQELPGGAVRARICDAGAIPWSAPQDALSSGLDELVVAVNSADPVAPGTECADDLGPAFTLSFQYEDGSTFGIRGTFGGCATIIVGHEERYGARQIVGLYADLLAQQRAGQDPPPDNAGVDPSCSDVPGTVRDDWRTVLYTDRQLDLSEAVLCIVSAGQLPREVALRPPQVAQVNQDFAARAGRDPGGTCDCSGPTVVIRGVDDWGDPYQLVRGQDMPAYAIGGWYWMPSADVQRMLAAAVE